MGISNPKEFFDFDYWKGLNRQKNETCRNFVKSSSFRISKSDLTLHLLDLTSQNQHFSEKSADLHP
jgi:hypothetical protein